MLSSSRLGILWALLLAASSLTISAAPSLEFTMDLAPAHGLPGISPAMKVTVINNAADPVQFAGASFRMEVTREDGSAFVLECKDNSPCGDYQSAWFETPARHGTFTVKAKGSRSFLIGMVNSPFFLDARMLQPGRYALRMRSAFGEQPSTSVSYAVDEQAGEDQIVWKGLLKAVSESDFPGNETFLRDDMLALMKAHPRSTYSRAWAFWRDLAADGGPRDEVGLILGYLANGVPESAEVDLKVTLASVYRHQAQASADAGLLDAAVAAAAQGRSILQALQVGTNSYASGAADIMLAWPNWTRDDLKKYGDQFNRLNQPKLKSIESRVNCVSLSNDGTFTAWFGYANPNDAV